MKTCHPNLKRILPLALLLISGFPAHGKTIRLFGSDLFNGWLPPIIEKVDHASIPEIKTSFTGSYGGMIALENGYADGCIIIQPSSKPPAIPKGYSCTTIGYYVLYLYAPQSFPDTSISKTSLATIASDNGSGTAQIWSTILETPQDWADQSTSIIMESGTLGIAASLFRNDFLRQSSPSDRILFVNDSSSLPEALLQSNFFVLVSPQSIAPDPALKAISLNDFGDAIGFPASAENIRYGDYSATYPILFIYPSQAVWSSHLRSVFDSPKCNRAFLDHSILPRL